MIGWGLQGTVPLPAGERLVPRGEARPTGQAPSAPSGVPAFPRGRKRGGLRNRDKVAGTGRNSWRTDTMGLGGGPQGSNLFPQAGRLTSSRSLDSEEAERERKVGRLILSRKLDLRKDDNKLLKKISQHFD